MATTTVETRRTELQGLLAMVTEGWAYCDANNEERVVSQAYHDRLRAEYDSLIAADAPTGERDHGSVDNPLALHRRRQGGSAHANQYGPCTVRYASEAQTRFVKSLMGRKDLLNFDNAVFNLAEIALQVQEGKINLKSCSALIDRLLEMPDRQGLPTGNPASDKQLAFILKLASEKALSDEDRAKVLTAVEGKTLSAKGASATIEKLMALPKAEVASTSRFSRDNAGAWIDGQGNLYRVYFGQQSGRMLCAKAVDGDLEYVGQAEARMPADARLATREEAGSWGKATGHCLVCNKALDDPTSVDRGIGPVCWSRMS